MSSARRFRASFLVTGTLALTVGLRTTAYATPSCVSRSTVLPSAQSGWTAPLDRSITVTTPEISLRAAIDRVAAESHLQLSYSADLIPADKRVCLNVDRMSAGSVINELLRGTMLRAIVLDDKNVALTPSRSPTPADPPQTPAMMPGVGQLDRVVVTGTAEGAKTRSSPFALDVIQGSQLARNDAATLVSAFDGVVPGLWMWSQAPSSMVSRFGSVRGASSFGVTSPKMYIDGIEVANPLVFTQFDADRIDRIEVIRGPQGAALYGADAISGVVNIVTRHDGASDAQPFAVFRTRAGLSTSAFANGAFVQDHSIALRAGTARKSFGVGLGLGTVGNYIPGGSAKSFLADGDARIVRSNTVFTGMARFALKQAGTLTSPVLAGVATSSGAQYTPMSSVGTASGAIEARVPESALGASSPRATDAQQQHMLATYDNTVADSNAKQSLAQYTIGTSGTWASSPRWTHTLVAGVDGYRLNGVTSTGVAVPVASNSPDGLSHSEADRTTLTMRSTARMGDVDRIATSFIVGAEQTATREEIEARARTTNADQSLTATPDNQSLTYWSNTAGVLSQVNSSFWNSLFLSAGGRVEYSSGAVAAPRVNLLPMLGAAFVRERDGQTIKLRAAYGKGIRPSNSVARAVSWMSDQATSALRVPNAHLDLASLRNLEPEAQAGTEIGADVLFGPQLGLHVTRFDQRATGLIQAVALPGATRLVRQGYDQPVGYELQNVGAITNRGWELQATSSLGRFALQGSASFVDSRVERVAMGYGGELRPGDRMLEVPAQTFGLTGAYSSPRWTTSWSLSRAMNWINYDQLAIAEKQNSPSFDSKAITGMYLRNFWREYDGANRLRGSFSYSLSHALSLIVTGDNLFNLQRGEPDNVTVVPGRTLTAGFRTRF